jgi:hypothetical protein
VAMPRTSSAVRSWSGCTCRCPGAALIRSKSRALRSNFTEMDLRKRHRRLESLMKYDHSFRYDPADTHSGMIMLYSAKPCHAPFYSSFWNRWIWNSRRRLHFLHHGRKQSNFSNFSELDLMKS